MIKLDKEGLKQFISSLIIYYKTTRFSKEDVLNILGFVYGFRSVLDKYRSSLYFKFIADGIVFHDLGKIEGGFIILNSENPIIDVLMKQNGL